MRPRQRCNGPNQNAPHGLMGPRLAALIGRAGEGQRMLAQTIRIVPWLLALASWPGRALESPLELAAIYAATVDKRLDVPAAEADYYAGLIAARLSQAALTGLPSQYLVLVDSSTRVQAVFVYWKATDALPQLIGASPASTGRVGRVDYFETPTGIFAHSLDNLDFRAEGTKNSKGIRGYGVRGMRVFDFGWQEATRGWGNRGVSTMRLQMHATDPTVLERRLGSAQSKGCIRIPATLNQLIDRYGLLDADYEQAQAEGRTFWVLHPARQSTPWSGRYLIVLDSQRESRPPWATAP